ncbi:hypothetical protein GPZ77_34835 (plasmid) [Streptomyces sp. QHH-9511]|uniref:hypothetical protein n=1 Tax=Streptomyces sp. QHH-9511 TaxID=2684468 RepID=UPI0013182A38|nr:hypothetical protein [Streptomyces sp. QHH-9511]QGZ53404.1 hypothetical protein GPZ77_34835 [Streptomyces sp. QHH-9511]
MSAGDDTTPAARLRLLQNEFLQPGRGRHHERAAKASTPSLPIRVAIYDHIQAAVAEATEHTRAVAPHAGPRPKQAEKTYEWMVEQTAHLDPDRQRNRDALIYRQGLEHAIVMGESKIICRHPCPGCGTWGLFWRRDAAVCVNRYCADDDGVARTWTLQQIAEDHIARKESAAQRAT